MSLDTSDRNIISPTPLRFHPYLKSVLWGGSTLCRYKGLPNSEMPIGESWEISVVKGFESKVYDGPYQGQTLQQLVEKFGESLLGTRVAQEYGGRFPLLIKFIDAARDVSVQVHPDTALARQRHGCSGKTEMWYIVKAEDGARIYSGLTREITPDEFISLAEDGAIGSVLRHHSSAPGDVFFIPPGRVHAIGAGNLLAEIQESSDITYRIHDYGRRDAQGNLRALHIDLARDAIDYSPGKDYKFTPSPSDKDVEIARCKPFTAHRLKIDGTHSLVFDRSSFTVLMCIEGECIIRYGGGVQPLGAGSSLLLPAVLDSITLSGNSTLIYVRS